MSLFPDEKQSQGRSAKVLSEEVSLSGTTVCYFASALLLAFSEAFDAFLFTQRACIAFVNDVTCLKIRSWHILRRLHLDDAFPFHFCAVREELVMDLATKKVALESELGPFQFFVRCEGRVTSWRSLNHALPALSHVVRHVVQSCSAMGLSVRVNL